MVQATGDGISEVRRHLTDLGLAQCTDAVVNEGFYTSVDALRVATYAGLLECGLQAAHAQTIVTSFGGKVPPEMTRGPGPARSAYLSSLDVPPSCAAVSAELLSPTVPPVDGAAEEVAEFLRMMGLGEHVDPVLAAGIVSIEHLVMASTEQLAEAGLPRTDAARLVASLDLSEEAVEAAELLTPPARRAQRVECESAVLASSAVLAPTHLGAEEADLDHDEEAEALLTGGAKPPPPIFTRARVLLLLCVLAVGAPSLTLTLTRTRTRTRTRT